MTTNRNLLPWPDGPDANERGKAAMLDAERRLHERSMRDPHYRNRQPTESDLAEYARMDAEEEAARMAYHQIEQAMLELSHSAPEGARLAGPLFSFRQEDAPRVAKMGRATVAHEEEYSRLARERERLMTAEMDLRTRNNQRRAQIALIQNSRGAP